jgi:hypothetical protein
LRIAAPIGRRLATCRHAPARATEGDEIRRF